MDTSTASEADRANHEPGRHLHRSAERGIVAGVAAGIAEWLDLDPTVVRLAFVVFALLGGLAVPLYVAGWLLIPDDGAACSLAEEWIGQRGVR